MLRIQHIISARALILTPSNENQFYADPRSKSSLQPSLTLLLVDSCLLLRQLGLHFDLLNDWSSNKSTYKMNNYKKYLCSQICLCGAWKVSVSVSCSYFKAGAGYMLQCCHTSWIMSCAAQICAMQLNTSSIIWWSPFLRHSCFGVTYCPFYFWLK